MCPRRSSPGSMSPTASKGFQPWRYDRIHRARSSTQRPASSRRTSRRSEGFVLTGRSFDPSAASSDGHAQRRRTPRVLTRRFVWADTQLNPEVGRRHDRTEHDRHVDLAEALLARGANVDAADEFGFTPLHEPIMNGHREMTVALCRRGASATRPITGAFEAYVAGDTAADIARKSRHPELVPLLEVR